MKFITIASDSQKDLDAQIKYLGEDGWQLCSLVAKREGRFFFTHLEKPL